MPKVLFFCFVLIFTSCKKDENPEFFQKKLAGTWHGAGEHFNGSAASWEATFVIEPNGFFTGEVTSVNSGFVYGVFNVSGDDYYNVDRRFIVHTVDSFGKARGVAKHSVSLNQTISENIYDLVFSNRYNTLTFTVDFEYPIYYVLTRQE